MVSIEEARKLQARAKARSLEDKFDQDCEREKVYVERQYSIPHHRYKWDYAVPSARLLIELNGSTWTKGGHSTGKGIQRDYDKANAAALYGWHQLTFSADDVHSGRAIATVKQFLKVHPPF